MRDKKNNDRRYYRKNRKKIAKIRKGKFASLTIQQRNIFNQKMLEYGRKIKKIVFDHYGWRCNCCGETIPKFLTVDHIDGQGSKDKLDCGRKRCGTMLYLKIIKLNFPDTYQILCWNCNSGKFYNDNVCPHKDL